MFFHLGSVIIRLLSLLTIVTKPPPLHIIIWDDFFLLEYYFLHNPLTEHSPTIKKSTLSGCFSQYFIWIAAAMNAENSGCGLFGRLLNSG